MTTTWQDIGTAPRDELLEALDELLSACRAANETRVVVDPHAIRRAEDVLSKAEGRAQGSSMPDEASIRADQREIDARIADNRSQREAAFQTASIRVNNREKASEHCYGCLVANAIASDIRTNRPSPPSKEGE